MEYVYGVVDHRGGDQEVLVLPADRAEELAEIADALRCRTWGELRATASPGRYRELLCRAGYGEFAELAAQMPIGNGVRSALEMALAEFDDHAVPPGDEEPFDAAVAEPSDYLPDPHAIQSLHMPQEIVDRWGEPWRTARDPAGVMLRAEALGDLIGSLEAKGHTCREDTDLIVSGMLEVDA